VRKTQHSKTKEPISYNVDGDKAGSVLVILDLDWTYGSHT